MFGSLLRPSTKALVSVVPRTRATIFRIAANSVHDRRYIFRSEPEEPLPPSFFEKYSLYEPSRFVPITVGFFGILTATGIYQWDAESQLLGLFLVFCSVTYTQAGPHIAKYIDDTIEENLRGLNAAEDIRISRVQKDLDHKKQFVSYDADVKAMVAAQTQLEEDLRQAIPLSFEERKKAFFKSKLDRIVAIETEAKENLQSALIQKATDSVKSAFTDDKNLQNKSFETALAWLQSPEGNKKEPTEVGDKFKEFFAKAKKDPNITKDIETKMKENIDRVLAEKFETVDEYKFLKSAN